MYVQYACTQCKERREQWGGAFTWVKFDASPFFQEKARKRAEEAETQRKAERKAAEAEAKRKAACKYTAILGKCNNNFCRKAKSDHYGPDHLCLDPADAAAAVRKEEDLTRKQEEAAKQKAAAEVKAKAEAEANHKQVQAAYQKAKAESEARASPSTTAAWCTRGRLSPAAHGWALSGGRHHPLARAFRRRQKSRRLLS
jgi:hypothetical protein